MRKNVTSKRKSRKTPSKRKRLTFFDMVRIIANQPPAPKRKTTRRRRITLRDVMKLF